MIQPFRNLLILFLILTLGGFASAAENLSAARVVFDSQNEPGLNAAILLNRESVSASEFSGTETLRIQIDKNPFSNAEWLFRFSHPEELTPGKAVFEIRYFDQGAGMIQPRLLNDSKFKGQYDSPKRQGSYTRLNTLKLRNAFFEFDLDPSQWGETEKPHIRIAGLQHLASISIHPPLSETRWKEIADSVPRNVNPMIRLERPMQLVVNAGVDPNSDRSSLPLDLERMNDLVPLAKVLGFTSIESYFRWNWIEPEREGEFDFTALDAIVNKIREFDMKWFPLLVIGSAYSLPKWFLESEENIGFICLEHGIENPIQSIWNPAQRRHVSRVLAAFAEHYRPMNVLEGVRLGPSGNFGESQYPAGDSSWPAQGQSDMHIHVGWWTGDRLAKPDYQEFLQSRYETIHHLNAAWKGDFSGFSEIHPRLPETMISDRERLDFTDWYTQEMTEWCEWWAIETRKALPDIPIYQCAGGWGFRESGTDFSAQTKSMLKIDGGVRLTNETDSFDQNFFATRLAATAARLYGVDLGFEPASSHTARGVVGRIFNTAANNGDHLFTYFQNIMDDPLAIEKWFEFLPVLDQRNDPLVEVAVYYPETMNQLEDSTFRHLYAWGFNPRVREIRKHIEVDFLDERLIRDGFLNRYKALVHVWGNRIESDVQERIDEWIRAGGVLLYPPFPKGRMRTLEGDPTLFTRWRMGDTGRGSFIRCSGDIEPPSLYGDCVNERLNDLDSLHPWTRQVLAADHSDRVFFSLQKDGHLLAINYSDREGFFQLPGKDSIPMESYSIKRVKLNGKGHQTE